MASNQTLFILIIFLFSCTEPTLIGDKDCAGVIGGNAIKDDCGYCTGGSTKLQFNFFLGCDGKCTGNQYDCTYPGDSLCISINPPELCINSCNGEYITDCIGDCVKPDIAREFDLCGICDPCGDGTKLNACESWNSSCSGCTNPLAACNSYNSSATVYKEGSCIPSSYYCEMDPNSGLLDITTMIDLNSTESDDCYIPEEGHDCGPNISLCELYDCNTNSDLESSFIPCNPELIKQDPPIPATTSDLGDGQCDYYGIDIDSGLSLNITSCPEFNYDEGDCNLIDCRGVHFSDLLCEIEFESDPLIDTLINSLPDSIIIQTSTLYSYIGGCSNAEYKDITKFETQYIYNSILDTVLIQEDTVIVSLNGWMGDGECDSQGALFEDFGLDFDCIKYNYEGGDCISLGRITKHHKEKPNYHKFYQYKQQ